MVELQTTTGILAWQPKPTARQPTTTTTKTRWGIKGSLNLPALLSAQSSGAKCQTSSRWLLAPLPPPPEPLDQLGAVIYIYIISTITLSLFLSVRRSLRIGARDLRWPEVAGLGRCKTMPSAASRAKCHSESFLLSCAHFSPGSHCTSSQVSGTGS